MTMQNLLLAADIPQEVMHFEVDGNPVQQGSKRAFVNPRTGRAQIVEDTHRDLKFWRGRLAEMASVAMEDHPLYVQPIVLEVCFTLPRPAQFKSRPLELPRKRPDLDKLVRAVGDALTNIVWKDDSQIVDLIVRKRYERHPEGRVRPGIAITIKAYGI